MSRQNKDEKADIFRVSVVEDQTHKQIWEGRFTRSGFLVAAISAVFVILAIFSLIVALTPVRTLIPGYPDSQEKREAIRNAIAIDSLENVIYRWELYSDNLRRVLQGEEPVPMDSVIKKAAGIPAAETSGVGTGVDSILRATVTKEEQFGLTGAERTDLPIEGKHFFCPLKGVVSKGYEKIMHPYIDITAPSNSVVMSVLDGSVIYSGWNDSAGYVLVIQHEDDIVSVYEHNQKLLKGTGDKVFAGTPVALLGGAGSSSSEEHLHFELWYRGDPVDATEYINF